MRALRRETKKARIEIIPMIDTIFFLLVFFMIQSLSMVHMRGISPNLPRAASGGEERAAVASASRDAIVTVTAKHEFYLGRTHLAPQSLEQHLDQYFAARPDSTVVVNMSPRLTTQDLIDVLDAIGRVRTPSGNAVSAIVATQRPANGASGGETPIAVAGSSQTGNGGSSQ